MHGLSGRYLMDQMRLALLAAFAMPQRRRLELALTARAAAQSGAIFPIKVGIEPLEREPLERAVSASR